MLSLPTVATRRQAPPVASQPLQTQTQPHTPIIMAEVQFPPTQPSTQTIETILNTSEVPMETEEPKESKARIKKVSPAKKKATPIKKEKTTREKSTPTKKEKKAKAKSTKEKSTPTKKKKKDKKAKSKKGETKKDKKKRKRSDSAEEEEKPKSKKQRLADEGQIDIDKDDLKSCTLKQIMESKGGKLSTAQKEKLEARKTKKKKVKGEKTEGDPETQISIEIDPDEPVTPAPVLSPVLDEDLEDDDDGYDAAPQVRIDEHGNVVVDKASVTIRAPKHEVRQLREVNEDRPRGVGYGTRTFDKWTTDETNLFFDVIRQVGSDFTLIQLYFPTRNRKQIKTKYKREEKKKDSTRFDFAIHNPIPWDIAGFTKATNIPLPDDLDEFIKQITTIESTKEVKDEKEEDKEEGSEKPAEETVEQTD